MNSPSERARTISPAGTAVRTSSWCALGLALFAGCGRPASGACPSAQYDIVYEGDSRGRGVMRIEVDPQGRVQAALALQVPVSLAQQRPSTKELPPEQPLQLTASGKCAQGKLHLTLSGAAQPIADRFTVMGGLLEGMLEPELTEPFGFWSMNVHDHDSDSRRQLRGFWQRVPTANTASAQHAAR